MPATVRHAFSNAIADGTNTQIVRPIDWNSAHNLTINAVGSEISGALSNANNVTFGVETNGYITASASQPAQTAYVFNNGNGISFGTNGSTVTATVQTNYLTTAAQSDHGHTQYLTTARASNDAIGLNSAITQNGVSMTANSAGLSLNFPAFLTTAMASNRGSDFVNATAAFAGTNATGTIGSAGISVSVGNYITTAAQSNHTHGNPTLALTNLTGTTASASNGLTISLSANAPAAGVGIAAGTRTATTAGNLLFETGNGITFGLNGIGGSVMTASHNGLTTAMASNAGSNFVGLNSALTANGVSATINSSGVSLNFPAFLTTAANSTHSHGNPTLALTNLTGTTASASNGFTISLSAAAPGAGGGAGTGTALNLTNLTGTLAVNTNGVSLSMSAANPGGGATPAAYWAVPPYAINSHANLTNLTGIDKRIIFLPFSNIGNLSCHEVMFPLSKVTSNQDAVFTIQAGIFSYSNSSRLDLVSSTQNAYSVVSSVVDARSIRLWEVIFSNTYVSLTPGQYVLGMWFSMNAGASSGMNFSMMGGLTANPYTGVVHPGTNATFNHTTHQAMPFFGRHSVTTGGLPSSMAATNIIGGYTGVSMPLPMHFTIGTHN